MNAVIFKTENAVFQFDRKGVEARLEIMATEYGVDEAETILKRAYIATLCYLWICEAHLQKSRGKKIEIS